MARLLVVGAGQVATAAAQAALADGVVDGIAGVVDADGTARQRLASALDAPGYTAVAELTMAREGDRALVILGPVVDSVAPVILRLLSLGYHAVSTCEELAWPPRHTWNALHTAARTHQRVIIMTGVNAGFVMDRLPLLAAAAARRVRRVTVSRRIDSSLRRESFLARTGRGLDPAAFAAAVATRDVGHRGLVPSAKLLAHALGWPNHDITEIVQPVLDGEAASGMRQEVTLRAAERTIRFELEATWRLPDPGDTIVVDGEPPFELVIPGGYQGDLGAAAEITTALRRCTELTPSFYRPTDLPLRFG
jgi:4-hydroxy-tetrahydrodipicolinate reductase